MTKDCDDLYDGLYHAVLWRHRQLADSILNKLRENGRLDNLFSRYHVEYNHSYECISDASNNTIINEIRRQQMITFGRASAIFIGFGISFGAIAAACCRIFSAPVLYNISMCVGYISCGAGLLIGLLMFGLSLYCRFTKMPPPPGPELDSPATTEIAEGVVEVQP